MSSRLIDAETVAAFRRDGAVALRGVFDPAWIAALRRGVAANEAAPGPYATQYSPEGAPGGFFGDYVNWQRIAEYRDFAENAPAAHIAADLMGAREVRFFHEHVLIKEPGTLEKTPWHHDQPYYCVDGDQIVSLWIPLDPVPLSATVRFVAGSHASGTYYRPRLFKSGEGYADFEGMTPVPDVDAEPDRHRILAWALEPGDCVAFHVRTLHATDGTQGSNHRRRGFAVRFTGDDARFALRPGRVSPPFPEMIGEAFRPGQPLDHPLFPVVWRAAA